MSSLFQDTTNDRSVPAERDNTDVASNCDFPRAGIGFRAYFVPGFGMSGFPGDGFTFILLSGICPGPGHRSRHCRPTWMCHYRFSNRPFGVKHFQTIHLCGVDVARGLVLLSGIGTRALPS